MSSCAHIVHSTAKLVISHRRNENVYKMSKNEMHVQSVQNHCFSLTNMQICGVFAVVVVVTYRFSPNLVDTQERSPKRHWWLVTLLFYQDNCLHSFIREALISRNAKYLCSVLDSPVRMRSELFKFRPVSNEKRCAKSPKHS